MWISRLQPAWGLSPAVHGRAVVERAALLICAACRARRVGHGSLPRSCRGRARQRLAPTLWRGPSPVGHMGATVGRSSPSGRGQALPDPSGPPGRATHADGCRGAVMATAGVVGSERPGLKPRAQSANPLKGAVRRPGARVDRLGAGAVGISRLQPAWGLSPAVHGRAVVDTGARLVCAACRARRVGRVESPRLVARAGEAAPRPDRDRAPCSPVGDSYAAGRCHRPRLVGVRRCLTRRPGRAGRPPPASHGRDSIARMLDRTGDRRRNRLRRAVSGGARQRAGAALTGRRG